MLPVVLYDPFYRPRFFPFHDFQPLWEIRSGALKTRERVEKAANGARVLLYPPEALAEICSAFSPKSTVVNDSSLPDEAVFVSSALLFSHRFSIEEVSESDITYHCKRMKREDFLELASSRVLDSPSQAENYVIVRYPWEYIANLDKVLGWDCRLLVDSLEEEGDAEYISPDADVQPNVVIDSTNGPVVIDKGAQVQPFSHLIGPLYIGKKTIVLGGRISHCSFGVNCRVAGEVSNSVFQDFVNKAHAGFIGHSYIGHFTNIGAMTTNSNLKNTYGEVKLKTPDKITPTGMDKLGMLCGPHTKFGIGSLISTGTLIGGFCNLFSGGCYVPKYVNHFAWYNGMQMETHRFDQAVKTASIMTARREQQFSAAETKVALNVYRSSFRPS